VTDHLPECPDTGCVYDDNDQCWSDHLQCICEELRACESRVLERVREADALWLDGYEHGIRDAYDAVDKGGRARARIEELAHLRSVTL